MRGSIHGTVIREGSVSLVGVGRQVVGDDTVLAVVIVLCVFWYSVKADRIDEESTISSTVLMCKLISLSLSSIARSRCGCFDGVLIVNAVGGAVVTDCLLVREVIVESEHDIPLVLLTVSTDLKGLMKGLIPVDSIGLMTVEPSTVSFGGVAMDLSIVATAVLFVCASLFLSSY